MFPVAFVSTDNGPIITGSVPKDDLNITTKNMPIQGVQLIRYKWSIISVVL